MRSNSAAYVDERLRAETRRYFKAQSEHNQKRWSGLSAKQSGERSRLAAEIMQQDAAMCDGLRCRCAL